MSGGDFSQPPFLQPLQQLANVPILPPVGAVGTPVETDAELLKNVGTTNGIRARKSFSLKEKIAHVTEFQKYIATEVNSRDNKTGKMKIWLKRKNDVEGVFIAYGTFYKWVQKYGTMIELNPSELSSLGNLKKLRRRPHEELELILVQYLKIRNENRQKKGLPLSTMAFIKEKAAMFHKDMYGEGDFKCSNGWVHRFKNRYMNVLEPADIIITSVNAAGKVQSSNPFEENCDELQSVDERCDINGNSTQDILRMTLHNSYLSNQSSI